MWSLFEQRTAPPPPPQAPPPPPPPPPPQAEALLSVQHPWSSCPSPRSQTPLIFKMSTRSEEKVWSIKQKKMCNIINKQETNRKMETKINKIPLCTHYVLV